MTNKRTTKKAPAEVGASDDKPTYKGYAKRAWDMECPMPDIVDFTRDIIEAHLMRQKLNNEDDRRRYQENFRERLDRRAVAVFAWAMKQDKEKLARLFTHNWIYEKALEKTNSETYINFLEGNAEMEMGLESLARSRRKGIEKKLEKDPKRAPMNKVKQLWLEMNVGESRHRSDAQFARDMMKDFGEVLTEGGIKNAISRWRKESSS